MLVELWMNSLIIDEVLHFLFDKIWLLSVDFQLNKSDNTLLRVGPSSGESAGSAAVSFDENKRVKSEIVKGDI